jgi:hypothetical protein
MYRPQQTHKCHREQSFHLRVLAELKGVGNRGDFENAASNSQETCKLWLRRLIGNSSGLIFSITATTEGFT